MTTNHSNNPLLNPFTHFDEAAPFDMIKVDHYLPALDEALKEAQTNLLAYKKNPAEPNFENSIASLELISLKADTVATIYGNLEHAHSDEKHQALAAQIYPKLTAFSSDVSLDKDVFSRVQAVYNSSEKNSLNTEQKMLLEKTYKSFIRNGALLTEPQKEKLRQIDQELSVLGPQFSENTMKATNDFSLYITDKADLAGLPQSAIDSAASAAKAKGQEGQWLFTLQVPSYIPFMTYSNRRELREKLWKAYNSKCFGGAFDNQEIIKKILKLKFDRAQLLGYKNHADFVLEERMAKNPETVFSFLNRILTAARPSGLKDVEEVQALATKLDQVVKLQPWDFAYYSEKLKEQKFAFNEEDLRPYFKLENVVRGVFDHAEMLYNLEFKENTTLPKYHPDVRAFEVYEKESSKYIGLFYTDFFPRETKKGGAWMTQFRSQGLMNGVNKRPHVSIVCNFTAPTESKPSLLTYDEVRTLFHEFGHALHGLLSDCSYTSLSGTNVYWDFVELPSQIMENWVGEKEGLDVFARHFETNEPMPQELVQKIKKSAQFQSGYMACRQLQFALLDMAYYSHPDPQAISSIDDFEETHTAQTRLFPKIAGTNSSCAFSHIFAGGYSAGYYSYKWAEVLDADAFEYFLEKGIFNKEVASSFKKLILSKGGTEHPMELYKKFRGREPDPAALMRREGLTDVGAL